MAIDYSGFKFGKWATQAPKALAAHRKRAKKDADLQAAYDKVDLRDKHRCQITGTALSAGAVDSKRALTRNHLRTRGAAPEERHDPDNILTVSQFVHDLMQTAALYAVDAKGTKTTRVSKIAGYKWNRRMVQPGKEPIRLREFK